jgi:hypothetical protein
MPTDVIEARRLKTKADSSLAMLAQNDTSKWLGRFPSGCIPTYQTVIASEVEPPFVLAAEKQRVAPLRFAPVAMTSSWEFGYINVGTGPLREIRRTALSGLIPATPAPSANISPIFATGVLVGSSI